ncbi:MAG TPA: IPT/TIG domain-containing protein [Acidimicrobiales bacterium]|nr:IPT/TIG domain-containing protein [Acidimicrobiales bacterium]
MPTVTGVAPTSGPTSGDDDVTITGTGFTGATTVTFGTVAATRFTVVSDTKMTAVSPAQAAGTRDILVSTTAGTSTPTAVDQFTYRAPLPTVTGVAPASGPASGGTTVTITGAGFTGTTRVVFGTVAATSFTVVSDTRVTAVSPAQAAGIRNIVLSTAVGTSALTAADHFTCRAPLPTVTGVAPASGPASGGTTVTITGTGFTGATRVVFGTVAATSFTVVSDTRITAVSPAQAASTRNIVVSTAVGSSALTAVDHFAYGP